MKEFCSQSATGNQINIKQHCFNFYYPDVEQASDKTKIIESTSLNCEDY